MSGTMNYTSYLNRPCFYDVKNKIFVNDEYPISQSFQPIFFRYYTQIRIS